MLRPSRDWRESITLSSRDPHFGQRIVSEHSVSHNNLWRQCGMTIARIPHPTKGNFVPDEDRPRARLPASTEGGLTLQQLWARQFFSLASPFFLRTRNQLFRFPISDKRKRRVLF